MCLNLKPSDAFRVSTVEYNFTITLRGLTLLSVLTLVSQLSKQRSAQLISNKTSISYLPSKEDDSFSFKR
jgi:hypothetical protein